MKVAIMSSYRVYYITAFIFQMICLACNIDIHTGLDDISKCYINLAITLVSAIVLVTCKYIDNHNFCVDKLCLVMLGLQTVGYIISIVLIRDAETVNTYDLVRFSATSMLMIAMVILTIVCIISSYVELSEFFRNSDVRHAYPYLRHIFTKNGCVTVRCKGKEIRVVPDSIKFSKNEIVVKNKEYKIIVSTRTEETTVYCKDKNGKWDLL